MDWQSLEVEEGDTTLTPCECCNSTTAEITGYILSKTQDLAWYNARWSPAHPETPLTMVVYTGDWSDGGLATARWGSRISVYYQPEPGCSLLDWEATQQNTLNSFTPLDRNDILGSSYEPELWACVDAILMKDQRLENFVK